MENKDDAKKTVQLIFNEHLKSLIRAGYAMIFLQSSEEDRTLNCLYDVGKEVKQSGMFVYDCRGSIYNYADPESGKMEIGSPNVLFTEFAKDSYKDKTTFAVLDMQFFIDDPSVIRSIKAAFPLLKRDGKSVVFIGPRLTIPPELEKDIHVVEFPLPDREGMKKTLDYVVKCSVQGAKVKIDIDPEMSDKLCESALGLSSIEAEDLFSLALSKSSASIAKTQKLVSESITVVLDGKCQIIKKDGILEYFSPKENMEDIGGLNVMKSWLVKRKQAFTQKARDFGLPHPKGVLLVGISGCGKSLTAKACASNWQIPLLRLDVGRVFTKFQGESEGSARKVIQMAECMAPCILWIDEIEKGLSGTKSSGETDSGVTNRVVQTFLTWMQEKTSAVFMVATANDVSKLPPELLRKGRFDEIFFVDLPNLEERVEILKIQLRKRNRTLPILDILAIGKMSDGFTGAELEQAVISGMFDCFESNQRDLTKDDVVKALKSFVPLSKTSEMEIKFLREWGNSRARKASSVALPGGGSIGGAPATFLRKVRREDEETATPE